MAGRSRSPTPRPPTEEELDAQRYWARVEEQTEQHRSRPVAPLADEDRGADGRRLPELGRRPFKPILPIAFRHLVRLGVPMTQVPSDYWRAATRIADQCPVAALACVCGAQHLVGEGEFPAECECARWFYFDGTLVWSLNSPVR